MFVIMRNKEAVDVYDTAAEAGVWHGYHARQDPANHYWMSLLPLCNDGEDY